MTCRDLLRLLFVALVVMMGTLPSDGRQSGTSARSQDFYSPLQIAIKVSRKTFRVNEPITGTVVIKNTYPATLPAVFRIRVFHDDRQISETTTSIETVPFGTTKFSFRNFGIPQFNLGPGTEGKWRIHISQQNVPSSAREITLRIVAPAAKS